MECMFTAQGPSVLHAIEVAVVQFAQVRLVYNNSGITRSSRADQRYLRADGGDVGRELGGLG